MSEYPVRPNYQAIQLSAKQQALKEELLRALTPLVDNYREIVPVFAAIHQDLRIDTELLGKICDEKIAAAAAPVIAKYLTNS